MSEPIIYEKVGQVAKIWLNRPEHGNTFTKKMLNQFEAALKQAEDDKDIRVIVLQGKGEHFNRGYDHSDSECILAAEGDVVPFEVRRRDTQNDVKYYFQLFDHTKPIIAGVRGDVMGSGVWLTVMSDCVIASTDTMFNNLEYAIGLNYSEPFPLQYWKLPMNIAMEFALTGYPMDAQTGHMYGLFNHVVEPDKVDEACMKLAHRMLRLAPYTLAMQHEIGTFAYELKGFKHIMPLAKAGIDAGLTITSTPESEEYWGYAKKHGKEALPGHFRELIDKLQSEDDWTI